LSREQRAEEKRRRGEGEKVRRWDEVMKSSKAERIEHQRCGKQ